MTLLRVLPLAVCIALAACKAEYASDPTPTVAVAPAGAFPDTLERTDTLTLGVRVVDSSLRDLSGAEVEWVSSDPTILEVVDDTQSTSLRARLRALGTGIVTVSVSITGGTGTANRMEYRKTILVLERWIAVSAGVVHSCAVSVDSTAFCWGARGTLGNGSVLSSPRPFPVSGLTGLRIVDVSAGRAVSCAREVGGLIYCWGDNAHGEVGNGTLQPQYTAGLGGGGRVFSSISVGDYHACGVDISRGFFQGDAVCWGEMDFAQLGEGFGSAWVPCEFIIDRGISHGTRKCTQGPDRFPLLGGTGAVRGASLDAGGLHSCLLLGAEASGDSGPAFCWGLSTVGQIGITGSRPGVQPNQCVGDGFGGWTYRFTFVCFTWASDVDDRRSFTTMSAGWIQDFEAHTCAIAEADSLAFCWGRNEQGELGTPYVDPLRCDWNGNVTPPGPAPSGSSNCSRSPAAVASSVKFAAIGAGARHTCALGALDSLIYCWGDNSVGQLGDGSVGGFRSEPRPVGPSTSLRFAAVSVGAYHACGVTAPRGAIYCWGRGSSGQLGTGLLNDAAAPVRVLEAAAP